MQSDTKNQTCPTTMEDESYYGMADPLSRSAEYTNAGVSGKASAIPLLVEHRSNSRIE
jgi:hypothetical protein